MNFFNRILLKDMTEDDLPIVLSWRNQDFVRKMMYNSNIISMEQHREWFEKLRRDKSSVVQIFYFDAKPCGFVNINKINYRDGTCEWSFYIGERDVPPGLGTMLGYLAIQFIFETLHLRKLRAEVLEFNQKSYHLHKKLGFEQEGSLIEHVIEDEQYVKANIFVLIKSKWMEHTSLLEEQIQSKLKIN